MRYAKESDQKQAGDDLAVAVEAGYGIAGLIEAMKLGWVVVALNTAGPAAVGSSHGQKVVPDLEEIQLVGERVEGVELDCSSMETPSISWMAAREQMCEEHNHSPFHAFHQWMVHGELVVLGRSSTDEEVVSTSAAAVAMAEVHKHGSQNQSESEYSCEAVQSTRCVDVEGVDWGEHKCVAEEAVAGMVAGTVAERPSAATFAVEVVRTVGNIEKMCAVAAGSVIGAKKTPKHR